MTGNAMNFFDVLFWMGLGCLLLIGGAMVRDALRDGGLPKSAPRSFDPSAMGAAPTPQS
jgi:hypothetical protein